MSGRRFLLGALAAAAASPVLAQGIPVKAIPSAVAPGLDAELIAVCQKFCSLERGAQDAVNAVGDVGFDDPAYLAAEDEVDRRRKLQAVLMDRICSTPATTPEGVAAIAAAAVTWEQPLMDLSVDCQGQLWSDRLQRILWHSAMAGEGAA